MPEPICSGSYARRSGVCAEDGPTADEVQREQQPLHQLGAAACEGAKFLGEQIAEHGSAHLVEHAFEEHGLHAAAQATRGLGIAVSALLGTYEAFEIAIHEPASRGEEIAEARKRDAANAAMAMVIQSQGEVLPAGFAQHVERQGMGENVFQSDAFKAASNVTRAADAGDKAAIVLRGLAQRSAREGLAIAYRQHLDSDEAIANARKSPEFERRWTEDPAFRLGVRGAVWQATFDLPAFERATGANLLLRAQVRS